MSSRVLLVRACLATLVAVPTARGESVDAPRPLFTEIGARALPGVETVCGSPAKDFIVEVNGGGVLLGDFDGDGRCDVIVVDGSTLERVEAGEPGRPARLFLGNGDATFRPAPEAWNLAPLRWGMGGATGDWNGDGRLDVVLTGWGDVRAYLNTGSGFRAVEDAGFVLGEWASSAAALDYDRDGKLDLVVVNYLAFDPAVVPRRGSGGCTWKGHDVMCGPEGLVPVADRLYRGRGDGTFVETTTSAKFVPEAPGFGLGATTLDYDLDGDTDVYVSNDSTPNHLWENQGDGTFREVGFRRGVSHDANGKEQASMGIGVGDLNGDLRPDLFVTNFSGETSALYLSNATGAFRERSSAARLAAPSLAMLKWGTTLADFDLDGDLDLSVVNGHVYPEADRPGTDTRYAQPAQWFENDGSGRFVERALADVAPFCGRASAAADLDGDGDLDLVALAVEGPVRVFRNDAPRGEASHWLRVGLVARAGDRDALGASVRVEWDGGRAAGEVRTSGGFQAAVPAEVHFGLGRVAALERVVVRWPSGREQVVSKPALDRRLTIHEDAP